MYDVLGGNEGKRVKKEKGDIDVFIVCCNRCAAVLAGF